MGSGARSGGACGSRRRRVPIQLPAEPGPFRLRVREVELVGSDAGAPAAQPGTAAELAERTVFTDVVAVPGA